MNLRFVLSHSYHVGIRSLRATYLSMISSLGFPLSLLFIVAILRIGSLLPYVIAGGMIAIFAIAGIYCIGDLGSYKFEYMYKDLVVTTKTTPMEYIAGVAIASILWSAPGILLYFVFEILYHMLTPYTFVMSMIIGMLILISTASIAFMTSSYVKHVRNVWSVSSILSILITVIPPTYYPYTYLPKWLLTVLMVIPTTSASVLIQGIFGLEPMVWNAFYVLIIETLIFVFLARRFTVWTES